jgi:ankyrin repeat protein
MAVAGNDYGMLSHLLELGAEADVRSPDGKTLLEIALGRRDFEVASLLVEHGARVDGMLHEAVCDEDQELVAFLLERGAEPNVEGEESPLVSAVREGSPEMALMLLEAGAKVPEGTVWAGQSLFHLAMARGDVDVVRALLQRGADANAPFAEPVQGEFLDLVETEGKIKWYLRKDRRVTPLMMAIDQGNLELVRIMLDYGASKSRTTRRYGFWPINFASQRKDVPMMQLLLGVDPDKEERWVKLDLSEQRAWVYNMDDELLFETRVSTGKKGYRTPTGSFVITNKYRHWTSTIYGASMPYFQRLSCGSFGFHQGYVPNYPASHGCLRVPSGNASKLFKITQIGDRVEIVE